MRSFRLFLAVSLVIWSSNSLAAADENCRPFEVNNGRISIPVNIAGTETRAIINSGLQTLGVSTALAELLGLEVIEPEPVSAQRARYLPQLTQLGQLSRVENVPVSVFGQDVQMDQLYVFDQDLPVANLSVMMFQDVVIQMDYPQSRMCVLPPTSINLEDVANISMRTTLLGAPAIEVIINGREYVWLDFQIGYPGGVSIDFETAEDLGFLEESPADSGGSGTAPAIAQSLAFGPYELGGINADYPTEEGPRVRRSRLEDGLLRANRRRNRSVQTHGELGYEIMQHFVITVDFNESRMHIFAP